MFPLSELTFKKKERYLHSVMKFIFEIQNIILYYKSNYTHFIHSSLATIFFYIYRITLTTNNFSSNFYHSKIKITAIYDIYRNA